MFEELFYHSLFLKRKFLTITIIKMLILSFVLSSCTSRETISITFDKTAEDEIIMAADELTEHFSKIYTEYNFRKNTQASKTIILEVNNQVNSHEEAYRLKTNSDSDTLAVIQGSDSKGLLYGVYDFLSMHGVEFLLSETIFPKQKEKILVFDTTLINFPHSNRRLVFNWHNFLTGVTSWNFREYKSWIDQSRRMKYNT